MYFFFCKQKTAYEMRISDWSSDVCSSDLFGVGGAEGGLSETLDRPPGRHAFVYAETSRFSPQPALPLKAGFVRILPRLGDELVVGLALAATVGIDRADVPAVSRSGERRGGKECVSRCRTRVAPYH